MTTMFFYGTLRHLPLLSLVLDRRDIDSAPAVLAGHRVVWASGESFPMILPDPDARAAGMIVRGLTETDVARLTFYEGGFHYDLAERSVERADGVVETARVFFPEADRWTPGAPWVLEDWVREWGALTLCAAEEAMSYFGRFTAQEVGERLPSIRRRAHAFVENRKRPADPQFDVDRDVAVERLSRLYPGFYSTEEVVLRHRQYNGEMGDPVTRAVLMVGQAAAVLPYDPARDAVLLVEQFRAPVYLSGDRAPWVWEPVAGLVDPGETPETTARREAVEEAGVTVTRLERAGAAYTSTGNSSEYMHLFVGLADLGAREGGGGLDSEGEDIRARLFSWDDFIAAADNDGIKNMELLMLANWLARHRDRLRAMA